MKKRKRKGIELLRKRSLAWANAIRRESTREEMAEVFSRQEKAFQGKNRGGGRGGGEPCEYYGGCPCSVWFVRIDTFRTQERDPRTWWQIVWTESLLIPRQPARCRCKPPSWCYLGATVCENADLTAKTYRLVKLASLHVSDGIVCQYTTSPLYPSRSDTHAPSRGIGAKPSTACHGTFHGPPRPDITP